MHYQTFPTKPPASRGRPLVSSPSSDERRTNGSHGSQSPHSTHESPLPKRQLLILAVIALAEQTALNSISPYLPAMASTFPEVQPGQVGLYVGLIASSFAFAQFTTNFFWGWLSDRIGRKPVVLAGTLLTASCFVAFGFCRTLWQAITVQVLMGLVNGNQGVISTCLGEITDRSNQAKAFTYLPVIYGIGAITGPLVGGVLVNNRTSPDGSSPSYPYLPPNIVSASLLMIDFVVTALFLEESLEGARDLPSLGERVGSLFAWIWQFSSSSRPSYLRLNRSRHKKRASESEAADILEQDVEEPTDDQPLSPVPQLFPTMNEEQLTRDEVFNRDTILLLATFLIFQLSNISYNSLYPIFAQAPPPTGRNLSPEEIGLTLAFAGLVTIIFQVGIFGKLRDRVGNRATYRTGLAGFVFAFLLMPWVTYKDDTKKWNLVLWIELGFVLIIKTIAAVGALTSALLLVWNPALL